MEEIEMTKECKVTLNNEAVTVVQFDGIEVQFPSIRKNDKTVFVKYEDGNYSIVDKPTIVEQSVQADNDKVAAKPAKTTRKRNKKTTNENAE
jgi:hypothetical protein